MTGQSKFTSFVFLALFGRKAISRRDYDQGGRFLQMALEEKKICADRLAPRLRIDPADIPSAVLSSLANEAAERAAKTEPDGVARWRSFFAEIMALAESVDRYLRGLKIADDRVRSLLESHRL